MDSTLRSVVIIGIVVLVVVFVMHGCKKVEISQKSDNDEARLSVKIDKDRRDDRY